MKTLKNKNQIHNVRYLIGMLTIFVTGCSTDNYQLQKVFVENMHTHFVKVQHAHDFSNLEHIHELSEYFPEEEMLVFPKTHLLSYFWHQNGYWHWKVDVSC